MTLILVGASIKYALLRLNISRPTGEWMTASHGPGIEVTATWGSEFICGLAHKAQVGVTVSVELLNAAELKEYWINSVLGFTIPLKMTITTTTAFPVCAVTWLRFIPTCVGSEFACAPSSPTVRRPTWRGRASVALDCRGQRFAGHTTKDLPIDCMLLGYLIKLLSLSAWIPWLVKVKCSCKLLLCLSIVSRRFIWGLGHKFTLFRSCCWMGMTSLFNAGESVTPPHTMTLQRRMSGLQNVNGLKGTPNCCRDSTVLSLQSLATLLTGVRW